MVNEASERVRLSNPPQSPAEAIFRAGEGGVAPALAGSTGVGRYLFQHRLDAAWRGIVGRQAGRLAVTRNRNPTSDLVTAAGASFLDGAIIGGPPSGDNDSPSIFVSGPDVQRTAPLTERKLPWPSPSRIGNTSSP